MEIQGEMGPGFGGYFAVDEISLALGSCLNTGKNVSNKINDVYINWMDCWNGNGSQKMGPIFRHFRRSPHAQ